MTLKQTTLVKAKVKAKKPKVKTDDVKEDLIVRDGVLCDAATGYPTAEPCACLRPAEPNETTIVDVPAGNFTSLPPGYYVAAAGCKMCNGRGYRPRRAGGYD